MINIESLDWTKQDGLIPAVVQDADTLRVLMLGYMSKESLTQTLQCGEAVFYSRSRAQLWRKGATSGNVLKLVSLTADCDNDTLLLLARPAGPTCHLDRASCFPDAPANFLAELAQLIETRATTPLAGSYTQKLFESGIRRIAQKVGEEGVEVALAGVVQDEDALLGEAADLSYHLLVLLRARGLGLRDLLACLEARH
ncbi:bifunctional phosphoribosyl-AMP cyclohydrolase/phosphoribosyl-ATP diphosphatase HisIE [Lysobacter soyae]|uniref:Histidine biosynthesis bifunctional protein HisIE n=1 Tax=Lysobacter soyae TaxID=2764185 RepID=A0ABX8WKX5_9GAMM|nr:bifunctional phosphoribosyl-AMP cyclohydrolase/phosphoribosyl-ATP diphosphatase HisIE [Lysobacter sp. CJ11]QYR52276.1 bifunctional phosphoribosyl-AMP cyclohydrolase/phosphoribosyl-ATP diphosphatase HisIE [Lysobacter sp. CJ11]